MPESAQDNEESAVSEETLKKWTRDIFTAQSDTPRLLSATPMEAYALIIGCTPEEVEAFLETNCQEIGFDIDM